MKFKEMTDNEKIVAVMKIVQGENLNMDISQNDLVDVIRFMVEKMDKQFGCNVADRFVIKKAVSDTGKYCHKTDAQKQEILDCLIENKRGISGVSVELNVARDTVRRVYEENKELIEKSKKNKKKKEDAPKESLTDIRNKQMQESIEKLEEHIAKQNKQDVDLSDFEEIINMPF